MMLASRQPLDPLRCVARSGRGSRSSPGDGFFDILLSGGIVGVMILLVLFALSIAAAYLVFDQFMTLRRSKILPDGVAIRCVSRC